MFPILGYQNRARAPDRTRAVNDPTQSSIFYLFLFYDFGSMYIHLIKIKSMAEQQHPATGCLVSAPLLSVLA